MSSRGLIRAVYLDRLYTKLHPRQVMLTPQVRDYIRQKLIITDIHVGEDRYAITACGDTEHAEGSAQDRVDDPGLFQQLGEDLGDFFNWLVKHWYVAIPIHGEEATGTVELSGFPKSNIEQTPLRGFDYRGLMNTALTKSGFA